MSGKNLSNQLRVLCVDDDRDTADSLAFVLELAGFEPQVCYDGRSALALADHFRPDACVLDLTMPGMDGCEVARRLRDKPECQPISIVAVTGEDDEEARRRTAEAGFDLHLTKPVNPDELAAVLADMVISRCDRDARNEGRMTHR